MSDFTNGFKPILLCAAPDSRPVLLHSPPWLERPPSAACWSPLPAGLPVCSADHWAARCMWWGLLLSRRCKLSQLQKKQTKKKNRKSLAVASLGFPFTHSTLSTEWDTYNSPFLIGFLSISSSFLPLPPSGAKPRAQLLLFSRGCIILALSNYRGIAQRVTGGCLLEEAKKNVRIFFPPPTSFFFLFLAFINAKRWRKNASC